MSTAPSADGTDRAPDEAAPVVGRNWRAASQLLAAQVAVLVGSMAANIVIARALGPDGRGRIALLLQASYLIAVFAILGRDRAYPALVHGRSAAHALGDQIRLAVVPVVLAAAGSGVVVLAFRSRLSLGIGDVLALAGLTVGVILSRLARAAAIASGRSGPFVVASVLAQALLIAGLIALWAGHARSTDLWSSTYVVAMVAPFVLLILAFGRQDGQHPDLSRARRGVALPTIAEMLVMRLDRILLPIIAGYGPLGLYVAVATSAEITSWPAQQWADSRIPAWSRRETPLRSMLREAAAAVAATVVIAGLGGLAIRVLLVPVFGHPYAAARPLVVPLSLAAVGVAAYRQTFSIVIARDLRRARRVQGITACLAAVVAYPLLISRWHAEGAAWASVIATFSAAVVPLVVIALSARSQRPLSVYAGPAPPS